jgi:ATP-binding cassette, subfamily B, bacterial
VGAATQCRAAILIALICHRFSAVRMADRILVLKNEQLVEQGTHEAWLEQGGLYSELFQLQAAGYR